MDQHSPSATRPIAKRFQPIMHDCRKMALSYLAPLLLRFIENAEVSLLEAADKAENNQVQAQYFAVMNALKRGQNHLLQEFLGHVDHGFRVFIEQGAKVPEKPDLSNLTADQLRLVEKHEMELALPVQNLISRSNASYIESLYGLEQRLAIVNNGSPVPAEAIPGGPYQIAYAFRDIVKGFESNKKLRMMLFAAFDRDLMRGLSSYLDEYNRRLINADILPHLKYEIRKHVDPRKSQDDITARVDTSTPGMQGGMSDGEVASTYDEIRGLMGQRRGGGAAGAGGASQEGRASDPAGQVALVNAIEGLQEAQYQDFQATPIENLIEDLRVDEKLIERLQAILNDERTRLYQRVEPAHLNNDDEDVIDLVGMLFDFMLRDEQVPNVVKALLSRLQMPYLKVAILDRAFFLKKSHPARRLLDAMIAAGSRWVVEEDLARGIFPCMRAAVDRILEDYADDVELFVEVLDNFRAHVRELEQKTEIIEKRAVAAADGQARLQQARRTAHAEIARCLAERQVPDEPFDFLTKSWTEKLVFILLREPEGTKSPLWQTAVATIQDIVDTVEPARDDASRQRLRSILPEARERIVQALTELRSHGRRDVDRMMDDIMRWQDFALGEDSSAPPVEAPVRNKEALEPQEPRVSLSPEERAIADELARLEFGVWFEFKRPDGPHRLRLAWHSSITEHYMFVDALGVKAAEYTRKELAQMINAGQVHMLALEDKPFLDRAMETILGWLGKKKGNEDA